MARAKAITLVVPRICTREHTGSGITPEQAHDDCEWLDEEDGEQNVLGNGRSGMG